MKKFILLYLALISISLFIGCSSQNIKNSASVQEQDPFIQEAKSLYPEAFKAVNDEFSYIDANISRIEELDKFLDGHEGYEFKNGYVYNKNSTFLMMNYVLYIRAYNDSNRCDLVYDYFSKIQSIGKSNYQVIDLSFNGNIYYPNENEDQYQSHKAENYESLIRMIGASSCIKCELRTDPEWVPEDECFIKSR